jgi:hypothetical protein
MTVKNIWLGNKLYDISGSGYEPIGGIYDGDNLVNNVEFVEKWRPFFNTLFMDSNARINEPDSEHPLRYAM